jgi:hypothetical protein
VEEEHAIQPMDHVTKCCTQDLFQYISSFAIVQSKGEEVTGWWKKLHSDKLHNLYSSATTEAIKSRERVAWMVTAIPVTGHEGP